MSRLSPISATNRTLAKSESGAALLLLMLVIIVGASFMLVSSLNANLRQYDRQGKTAVTLSDAKAALITYALTYPEKNLNPEDGPGYLPCPDRTDPVNGTPGLIGSAGSSCSLSGGTVIGRFPWKTLNTSDLRDHTGERLWYAVSENFKNNPKILPYLNSDSPGTISVDAVDDIVAVIIAPGTPIAIQDRDISNAATLVNAANYLEGGNESGLESYTSRATGEFNDQLIYITRQELMDSVEQRVVNRVRGILQNYYTTYGAYPWLAPFADPKADAKWLKGEVSSTSSNLVDTSVDFTDWGVTAGDPVWNLTDGSTGVVNTVSATTLTLTTGLKFGTNNTFTNGDEYYVEPRAVAAKLKGTATAGSSGLVLRDSARDFDELSVAPGDILEVDNVTDVSSGMIVSASNTAITVKSLTGGTITSFSTGQNYRIRTNTGVAGSSAMALEDSTVDFIAMNVQPGDMVRNHSQGTSGPITIVAQHTLDVTGVSFVSGNNYSISRNAGITGTTNGLLSIHVPGTAFNAGFQIDWSLLGSDNNVITSELSATNTPYNNGLIYWVQTSSGRSGTLTVNTNDADCNWIASFIVDCRGSYIDTDFLSGTATATSASQLTDSSRNFTEAGVKSGDLIETATGDIGIINQVSSTDTIRFVQISTAAVPVFAAGDEYRIYIATRQPAATVRARTGTTATRVTFNITAAATLVYNNFGIDDVIQDNATGNVGRITNKGINGAGRYYFDYTTLHGSSPKTAFASGDFFIVFGDYVAQRQYTFDLRFGGSMITANSGETRTRTVCRGYDTDCATGPLAIGMSGDGSTKTVIISDYDSSGTLLGRANSKPASSGTPLSSIRVSGLNYQLADDVDDELPSWFLKNRWHQLIYVAYADGFKPSGSGSCTTGSDCLEIEGTLNSDDREALVISAGMELETDEPLCPDIVVSRQKQNRSNGRLCDYYEGENADDSDNLYTRDKPVDLFNDKLINIAPATF
jgi:hypothetical protein